MRHTSPSVSELLPDFLEYLRVEEQRTSETLLRYQQHIHAFITSVGDCPVGTITSEKLSIYKRPLLDRGLSAATLATMFSGLRRFLRYLRDIRGLTVYAPAKVRRPAIPKREVDYLWKTAERGYNETAPMRSGGFTVLRPYMTSCSFLAVSRYSIDTNIVPKNAWSPIMGMG